MQSIPDEASRFESTPSITLKKIFRIIHLIYYGKIGQLARNLSLDITSFPFVYAAYGFAARTPDITVLLAAIFPVHEQSDLKDRKCDEIKRGLAFPRRDGSAFRAAPSDRGGFSSLATQDAFDRAN